MSEFDSVAGIHAVSAALDAGEVTEICFQQGLRNPRLDVLRERVRAIGLPCRELDKRELNQAYPGRHQGVIAQIEARASDWSESDIEGLIAAAAVPLVLVLDGVTDPHNLGACLRTADATGVTAVIAPKDNAVGITTVVRKVASGAAEHVPFIAVTNLARTLKQLQRSGLWVVGTSGDADKFLYEEDLKIPLALVMGSEGKGMRRLTREHCDFLVKLPMLGSVESLNISVAAGVCLYEAVRQRGSA